MAMKIKDLGTIKRKTELPTGIYKGIKVSNITVRTNEDDEVENFFLFLEDYRPLYLAVFEEDNWQLDALCEQLECETYAELLEEKCIGKTLNIEAVKNGQYTNIRFLRNGESTKAVKNYA